MLNLTKKMLKNMPQTLDKLVGEGAWVYDKDENLYIIKNPNYKGQLFGFIAIKPDGSWFTGERPFDS